jgi:hypothetical protein
MSSPINAPTTILPADSVSSTGNPTLFEQPNDSVHNVKIGGRRRRGSRKSKKGTKRRTGSNRRTAKRSDKRSAKRTFLNKWMVMKK